MISLQDYFGPFMDHKDATHMVKEAADDLLSKVNALLLEAERAGAYKWLVNPLTGSNISGSKYGGFRPKACPVGAWQSKHKQGHAVDIYDPMDTLDAWITNDALMKHGLWREDPGCTDRWVHLQDIAPRSGSRTFLP